jgi:aldehyde dehydrogenase (NAD+)
VPGEAVALANNTYYGLGASVWTENVSLALEVAIQIKAGTVWVNAHNLFDAASGFGGYRESGYGRDGGKEGLYDYVKPSWMPKRTTPEELKFPCEEIKWASKAPSQPASVESSNAANRMAPIGNGSIKIDHTRKMYIGGKQKRPDGNYSRPVLGPNKEMVDEVGDGNRKDIRDAVTAAAAAAGGWGKRAAHNRAQICYYIAENLQIRFAEFSGRLAAMTGRDVESCNAEVEMTIQRLFHWAAYADKYGGTVQETSFYGVTTKIHEPVGVVAIACPDEFPLLSFVSLIAPALVRGNTVVVVPSEAHPLCAVDLYQVFDTSDLPGGVVNIVTGNRDMLTQTLAEHNEVQSMWYFGSAKGSQCVEYVAGENMKRTWVNFGATRDWMDLHQGQGEEFLVQSVECKAIWIPFGEISGA